MWEKITRKDERGQALVLVLILLLIGALIITPLMSYTATELKAVQLHDDKMLEFYAADAGVEHGIWGIKHDQLDTLLTDPAYDVYDYTTVWTYSLSEQVNTRDVQVNIENIWVPKNIPVPSVDEAKSIVQTGKLILTGSITDVSTYTIKISFYPASSSEVEALAIEKLGVWLPAGFDYIEGSSNLEENQNADYYSEPIVSPYAGGQAVEWDFSSYPFASSDSPEVDPFPGVNPMDFPITSTITFQFVSSQPESNPEAISWITTSGVSDIPFSWDADTKVYRITSIAGDTEVEAYIAKNELRVMSAAVEGDYRAAGSSLMVDTLPIDYSYGIRDTLLTQTSTTISDIPSDAKVAASYLYWSAWRAESAKQGISPLNPENCSDFDNWDRSTYESRWTLYSGRFRGEGGGSEDQRTLTLKNSLDLSSCTAGTVIVTWEQDASPSVDIDDYCYFAFSDDAGISWSEDIPAFNGNNPPNNFNYVIPAAYLTDNFKMKFFLDLDSSTEYAYIDNIQVSVMLPDTSAVFKIDGNQVYYSSDGSPTQGDQELTADTSQVLPNYNADGSSNGFSYACRTDVTALVQAFTAKAPDPATNHPGNGSYTVGSVAGDTNNQWSYAGWSLVIIYTSPQTKGHQLYLYDDFIYAHNDTNIDFDQDGEDGGTISGFLVPDRATDPFTGLPEDIAAKMTVFVGEGDEVWSNDSFKFNGISLPDDDNVEGLGGTNLNNVWNGQSIGMSADGVDVDTFYVRWEDNLLSPYDTSAHIDLPTKSDSWNLVYIILSFRSESRMGGTIIYLIR